MVKISVLQPLKASRGPIQQSLHVAYEILYFLLSLVSRSINAIFFKGSMHQTLSSRAHIEAFTDDKWKRRESFIDLVWKIFSLGFCDNHCSDAWEFEVTRAYKTLERNKVRVK